MIEKFIEEIKDEATREAIRHIFREGQGKPLTLGATPTATVPLLLNGQSGYDPNGKYWKREKDVLYEYAATSTTTVT